MNEAITFQPQLSIWRGARRLDLLARLVRTCRGAAGRGSLGTAEETLISRSTGGRC